jgi:hypothetical protein
VRVEGDGEAHSNALGSAVGAGGEPGEDSDHRRHGLRGGSKVRCRTKLAAFLGLGSTDRCSSD